MAKAHVTIRNKKREKITSGPKPADNIFEEVLLLLHFILSFLLDLLCWIKVTLLHSAGNLREDAPFSIIDPPNCLPVGEEEEEEASPPATEESEAERTASVTVRGVGLIAAYSGRRAIFAVYPPLEDGLEVSGEGPVPLHFEYKQKEKMLLVGYEAPVPGRYKLRVSRFGRAAQGSPFVLTVDDPPPGYRGHFGAALWHDLPVRPPTLSGIVDFVTERLYLDENGRLFKLNKDGTVSDQRYFAKRGGKSVVLETPTTSSTKKIDKQTETTHDHLTEPVNLEICNVISSNLQKSLSDDEIMAITKTSIDKHKHLSIQTLSKELNTDPKILNSLGIKHCGSNGPIDRRQSLVIPKITITNDEAEKPLTEHNHSRVDQFLLELESRYTARRTAKLERVAEDDAVSSEACDGRGQIGALGQSPPTVNDSKLIGFILQSGRGPKVRKKYHPSNIAATLGFSKKHDNQTGIRLLHGIYRIDETQKEKEDDPNLYCDRVLNNGKMRKKNYKNVHKLTSDRDLEINNLDVGKIPCKIHNSKKLRTTPSESKIQTKKTGRLPNTKFSRKKQREPNWTYGSFRTLSLPDFNRILSLSVQGLRKAKSCGDKSFRALSSSSLSLSLKSLFEKDQVYHVNKKSHSDKTKSPKEAATLVRIAHYGAGKEDQIIETGSKSVFEWRKYWESAEYRNPIEPTRGCHLQVKGIVTKGKELFESASEDSFIKTNSSRPASRESTPKNVANLKYETKEENKSAFQKAKEIFEGNYSSLKCLEDPQFKCQRSLSERFHISSLSEDIYSGVTPEHLGIPNRIPMLASLGSVYDYNTVYHQIPLTNSPEQYLSCTDLLFLDPSYV